MVKAGKAEIYQADETILEGRCEGSRLPAPIDGVPKARPVGVPNGIYPSEVCPAPDSNHQGASGLTDSECIPSKESGGCSDAPPTQHRDDRRASLMGAGPHPKPKISPPRRSSLSLFGWFMSMIVMMMFLPFLILMALAFGLKQPEEWTE